MQAAAHPDLRLDAPTAADAAAVARLVRACPPLDPNSTYAYLLLATHFAGTCVVARDRGGIVGFLSAYVPPAQPEVLFVWQVAVAAPARGRGLAAAMLDHVLLRPAARRVAWVEATVNPSNAASQLLFARLAARRGTGFATSPLFTADLFPDAHEDELLVRVGPLPTAPPV